MKTSFLLTVLLMMTCSITQAQINSKAPESADLFPETRSGSHGKKTVVKLFSKKDKGSVLMTSHRRQEVQFYIFDLEGTIMRQGTLRAYEKRKIKNLDKGTYTYTIFQNDESVEEGQLVIK